MITHFIILSSSYSYGTRIALDFIIDKEDKQQEIKQYLDRILEFCGKDVSISTHMIQTESKSWESVVATDHFFKDVRVVANVDSFIKLIKKDRELRGIDIAKYVLSKVTCTQLKLQKLVYLCFADYLCETGKELFSDKIYAYQYGPVVDSVLKKYKKYGYKPIEKETKDIKSNTLMEMPTKSRILFAEDGTQKLQSIEETLKKYGNLSASQLVDITHREKSPWSMSCQVIKLGAIEIKRDTIKKYHSYEVI